MAEKVFASLPQVERGVSKVIGGDPKGNSFLYTNGKCVILRNIDALAQGLCHSDTKGARMGSGPLGKAALGGWVLDPAVADIYTEHAHQVVVAKYAPSGFYVASGDVSGKLRIWDTTQKEHLLKYEYQPFAGKIKDIAWTEDSKRIAVVGEGREKFGAVFLWDSGSSVGEITGHNKVINSVDIKQTRPYRLVTGSDDNCAAFFEGPPFKFKFTIGGPEWAVVLRKLSQRSGQHGDNMAHVQAAALQKRALLGISAQCVLKQDPAEAVPMWHESSKLGGPLEVISGPLLSFWPMPKSHDALPIAQSSCRLHSELESWFVPCGPQATPALCTLKDHSRFVNCVRFSPDGNRFATASADGQIFIYDGKTGEKVCALGGSKAHDGGIYAISWSPDSTHLLSASGDKSSKIWDVSANSVVSTFPMGSTVLDQQLGCLWQKDHLLSISLSGYINYLDKNNPSKPLRVIKGHSKSIQCLTVHRNGSKAGSTLLLNCALHYWDSETGENDSFSGKGHTNQVCRMTVDESGRLVSCSMDDTVRYTSLTLRDYSGQGVVKLDVQPKCVAVGPGGYAVVVCIGQGTTDPQAAQDAGSCYDLRAAQGLCLTPTPPRAAGLPFRDSVQHRPSPPSRLVSVVTATTVSAHEKCFSLDNPSYEPEVVALHPGGDTVAVGGTDGNVHIYSILGTTLRDEGKLLEAKGPVTDVAYSHDGAFLAVSDASKVVTVFSVTDDYAESNVFYGHHAKVMCLAWSPDNEHFASGGMDMMVYVWTLSDPETRVKIQDAHRLHHVSSLAWLDEHTLVTTSHDASVKEWTITY
ncbi:WD repeat-containing protein 1 [Heterocephalus glaber]|uniref:WD repeat-containing protein 1 n=1 Tax=Heterocephalus glaber TaxID=10181 RepID=G5B2Y7_HETGA|nr:WD repeat-containing protein 1 [Heterocephalus glaber]